jgi:hypothetical protein
LPAERSIFLRFGSLRSPLTRAAPVRDRPHRGPTPAASKSKKEKSMGYDLYGTNPTSAAGSHLRHPIWRWHPLVELCQALASDESNGCTGWLINDGYGLNHIEALGLAGRLQQLLSDGSVASHLRIRQIELQKLPANSPDRFADIDENDVREFIAFLRESGGFEIS